MQSGHGDLSTGRQLAEAFLTLAIQLDGGDELPECWDYEDEDDDEDDWSIDEDDVDCALPDEIEEEADSAAAESESDE